MLFVIKSSHFWELFTIFRLVRCVWWDFTTGGLL